MTDVFAHRGFHLTERENTIGAFRAAVALGVDGVEFDVRRTLDGVLVIHHDPAIGELAIAQTHHSELPSYVPTMDEALGSLSGVRINVEIKNGRGAAEIYDGSGDLERQVLGEIKASGRSESVIVSCFDLATCVHIRSIDREIAVAWLLWGADAGSTLVQAHVLGFNAVNPHFSTVDDTLVERARELQLEINVWTVTAAEDVERMVNIDVAGVITDDPELARAVVTRVKSMDLTE